MRRQYAFRRKALLPWLEKQTMQIGEPIRVTRTPPEKEPGPKVILSLGAVHGYNSHDGGGSYG
jgi:hypothetical protein